MRGSGHKEFVEAQLSQKM